jgi:hypothetical protein
MRHTHILSSGGSSDRTADDSLASLTTLNFLPDPAESPQRESLRVLVMGSRQGVTSIIHNLHRLGFAEVGEWSPLLPAPVPGEVMSILTRYILAS